MKFHLFNIMSLLLLVFLFGIGWGIEDGETVVTGSGSDYPTYKEIFLRASDYSTVDDYDFAGGILGGWSYSHANGEVQTWKGLVPCDYLDDTEVEFFYEYSFDGTDANTVDIDYSTYVFSLGATFSSLATGSKILTSPSTQHKATRVSLHSYSGSLLNSPDIEVSVWIDRMNAINADELIDGYVIMKYQSNAAGCTTEFVK